MRGDGEGATRVFVFRRGFWLRISMGSDILWSAISLQTLSIAILNDCAVILLEGCLSYVVAERSVVSFVFGVPDVFVKSISDASLRFAYVHSRIISTYATRNLIYNVFRVATATESCFARIALSSPCRTRRALQCGLRQMQQVSFAADLGNACLESGCSKHPIYTTSQCVINVGQ